MIFLSTMTYPGTSLTTAAKKFVDIVTNNPLPEYIKRTYYVVYGGKGVKVYILYDIEDGKESESFKEIPKRFNDILQSVEGAEVNIEVLLKIEDALASIGMQAP